MANRIPCISKWNCYQLHYKITIKRLLANFKWIKFEFHSWFSRTEYNNKIIFHFDCDAPPTVSITIFRFYWNHFLFYYLSYRHVSLLQLRNKNQNNLFKYSISEIVTVEMQLHCSIDNFYFIRKNYSNICS